MYIKGKVSQGQTLDSKSLCLSSLPHWDEEFWKHLKVYLVKKTTKQAFFPQQKAVDTWLTLCSLFCFSECCSSVLHTNSMCLYQESTRWRASLWTGWLITFTGRMTGPRKPSAWLGWRRPRRPAKSSLREKWLTPVPSWWILSTGKGDKGIEGVLESDG